jgi:hypothetical protein
MEKAQDGGIPSTTRSGVAAAPTSSPREGFKKPVRPKSGSGRNPEEQGSAWADSPKFGISGAQASPLGTWPLRFGNSDDKDIG